MNALAAVGPIAGCTSSDKADALIPRHGTAVSGDALFVAETRLAHATGRFALATRVAVVPCRAATCLACIHCPTVLACPWREADIAIPTGDEVLGASHGAEELTVPPPSCALPCRTVVASRAWLNALRVRTKVGDALSIPCAGSTRWRGIAAASEEKKCRDRGAPCLVLSHSRQATDRVPRLSIPPHDARGYRAKLKRA